MPEYASRHMAPARLAALLPALLFFSCAPADVRQIEVSLPDTVVTIEAGHPEPAVPPHPSVKSLTVLQAETSLRRLVVRLHGWSVFSLSDPKPLLSEEQVGQFAAVLAREIPALLPDQRIWLAFNDQHKGLRTEGRIHAEGEFLVYSFNMLMREDRPLERGDTPTNGAEFEPQPGQQVEDRSPLDSVLVKDPVRPATLLAAQVRGEKLALIAQAQEGKVIAEQEAAELRKAVDAHADISVNVWRRFFEKRETLEKAKIQGLIDESIIRQALVKLRAQMGI